MANSRMVEPIYPEVDMVVMGRIDAIREHRAVVHLLEYNINAYTSLEEKEPGFFGPLAVGRIEPFVVVRRRNSSVRVSRDNIPVGARFECEGNFTKRTHTKSILALVASATTHTLEEIYDMLGWPDDLSSHEDFNIPDNVRTILSQLCGRMIRNTWRIRNPSFLAPTWRYVVGWCWAVAMTRQFEAVLKWRGLIEPDVYLSVQDLINKTPSSLYEEDGDDKDILSLEDARYALCFQGIVAAEHCPIGAVANPEAPTHILGDMEVVTDTEFSEEAWDKMLSTRLASEVPFAAAVMWFPSYRGADTNGVYRPTDSEQQAYERTLSRHLPVHTMLLSGSGTDEDGTEYLEFQDTSLGDIGNGDRGFLRFARYPCPVFEFVRMKALIPY